MRMESAVTAEYYTHFFRLRMVYREFNLIKISFRVIWRKHIRNCRRRHVLSINFGFSLMNKQRLLRGRERNMLMKLMHLK